MSKDVPDQMTLSRRLWCSAKRIAAQSIVVVGVAAAIAAALEYGLRAIGVIPLGPKLLDSTFYSVDSRVGFRAPPNASWYYRSTPSGERVNFTLGTTNALGYRPSVVNGDCKDCPIIIALGDSVTFGAESSDRETWPEFMATALKSRGLNYRVVNISARGWGTLQQAMALVEIGKIGKVEYVVHVPVFNDATENIIDLWGLRAPLIRLSASNEVITDLPRFGLNEIMSDIGRAVDRGVRRLALTSQLLRIIGKERTSDLPIEQRGPFGDADYKEFWKNGQLQGLYNHLSTLTSEEPASAAPRAAIQHALQLIKSKSLTLGARPIVVTSPWGPFSNGRAGSEFADLMRLDAESERLHHEHWKKYNKAVVWFAQKVGIEALDASSGVFDDMSYRDYAAAPNDWHYSASANRRFGEHLAGLLIDNFIRSAAKAEISSKKER